ncbi:MAG: hypothetical protein MRY83_01305 [Flavobacteriales bacterium]|nr:hypothetical protein [Flavobacteriales bacterium]
MDITTSTAPPKQKLWNAAKIAEMYGYKDLDSFKAVIQKSVEVLYLLDIPYWKHVFPVYKDDLRSQVKDFEMSRFACFLAAMEADDKKANVEEIQMRIFKSVLLAPNQKNIFKEIERIKLRKDLSDAFQVLNKTIRKFGGTNYPNFMEAGYKGMYNMRHEALLKYRKLDIKSVLYDHIGKLELSFHIQKIIFVENAIRGLEIKGQYALEKNHEKIATDMRGLIMRNSGIKPEQFSIRTSLPNVIKNLKNIAKELT